MSHIAVALLGFLVLDGCMGESEKTYEVVDTYHVVAGPQKGLNGSSKYEIKISMVDKSKAAYAVKNFANSYTVTAILSGNNITIPKQVFPYYQGKVTIYGQGVVRGDSVTYDYFSGGPAGQINCSCIAVLKK